MRLFELSGLSPNGSYDVRDQLKNFIYKRSEEAFGAGDAARDKIGSIEELKKRRTFMRTRFIEALGGLPSNDTPLNPKVIGTVNCDGFRIEKIIFESRPKAFVTTNLYVPDGIASPRGAVLFVCGHHMQAKHVEEYQTVCRYLVRAGLVVLAQDPIGQGERFSYYEKSLNDSTIAWGCPEHSYTGCQCWQLGDSIGRYFVHDAMRSIDYLCTRPEVDPGKIGITGNSGGGLQSSMMMVCDTRIAAAAPTTFIMNRRTYMHAGGGQDAEQIWPGMTALGFDHEDVLLAMAPKPVLVLSVKYDFFPIEGTRSTVERVRRFWQMHGKGHSIELFEDTSTHLYTRAMAKKAAEFFSLHLNGKMVSPADDSVTPIAPSLLWCTESGQVRGEIAGARFAHEENVDRIGILEKQRSSISPAEYKEKALSWLREKVFGSRKPYELNPRHYFNSQVEDFSTGACFWWSQENLLNHAIMFRDYRFIDKNLPLTIAVWEGGTTEVQEHIKWLRATCSSGRAVMVLDVSGTGGVRPNILNDGCLPTDFHGVNYKFTTDLIFLNDSLAAMRAYDVIRALDMAGLWPGVDASDIKLYAHGRHGVYAQLAGVLDERVRGVDVVDGIGSFAELAGARHYDSHDIAAVSLPGVLKYFDLPDLEKWTAQKARTPFAGV